MVGDYDSSQLSTNAFESDPKHGVLLWPLMVAALVSAVCDECSLSRRLPREADNQMYR